MRKHRLLRLTALSLSMVFLSSVGNGAFAAFQDVPEDSSYSKA